MKPTPAPMLLSMRNIHVTYGFIKALNGVDFDLAHGEIHALVGEHRAGKSSLVKILSGAERRKEGTLLLEGKPIGHLSPKNAADLGVGIVYQNLSIIPDLNTVENIFTGRMLQYPFFTLKNRSMREKAREVFDHIGFSIDLDAPLYRLSAVQQNMVEFARALLIDPKILILDELSNKLTPEEMKKIYRIIFELKGQGKSVIYISHDMDEVLKLADRVTILKNGYRRETAWVKNLDNFRLIQLTYSFSLNQQKLEYLESRFTLLTRYLETLIQNFPIGVVVLDPDKQVRLINYAAVDILNYKHKPAINHPLSDLLQGISITVREDIKDMIDSQRTSQWDGVQLEEAKLLKIYAFPLRDDDENFIGSTLVFQDISMDKDLNDYFIQSEKMASVAEVAVGVAHEINNPLFIIQNYIELIKVRSADKDTQEKIGKIESELERIVEILTSLLSFSRIKNLPDRRVNPRIILDETILLLTHAIAEKRIRIIKHFPPEDVFIVGEENKFKQLFMNLLSNSIDAVLDNGKIEIRLSEVPDSEFIEVAIQDNGSGIPEDLNDKIFSPFFSTKISKKNTGLGLSICRHILEELGGTIGFTSIPGQNTVFTIRLPFGGGDSRSQ